MRSLLKTKNSCLSIIIAFGISMQLQAQITPKEAINLIKNNKFTEAVELLSNQSDLSPNGNFYLGYAHWKFSEKQYKAIPYFESAMREVSQDVQFFQLNQQASPPEAYYFLGDLYRKLGLTDLAAYNFSKYIVLGMDFLLTEEAQRQVVHLSYAKILKENPLNFLVKRLVGAGDSLSDFVSGINYNQELLVRSGDDYNLISFNDTSIVSKTNLNIPNVDKFEAVSLTNNMLIGKRRESDLGLSVIEYEGYNNENLPLEVIEAKNKNSISVSDNGKYVVFDSDKKGKGKYNIQVLFKNDKGSWVHLIKLEKAINTEGNERHPFIDENNERLYFSSTGHETMGGYDIFYVNLDETKNNNFAINVGFPINSSADDILYTSSTVMNKAFFSSNRGAKDHEVYMADYSKSANPDRHAKILDVLEEINIRYTPSDSDQSGLNNGASTGIGQTLMYGIDNLKNIGIIKEVEREVEVLVTMEIEKEVSVGYVDTNDVSNVDILKGVEKIEVEKEVETILIEQLEVEKVVEKEVEVTELVEIEKEVSVGNIAIADIGSVDLVNAIVEKEVEKEVEVIQIQEVEISVGYIDVKDVESVDRVYAIKEINVGEIDVADTASVDRIYGIKERIVNVGQVNLDDIAHIDVAEINVESGFYHYNNYLQKNNKLPNLSKDVELSALIEKLKSSDDNNISIIIEVGSSRYKQGDDGQIKEMALKSAAVYEKFIQSKLKSTSKKINIIKLSKIEGPNYKKGLSKTEFSNYQYVNILAKDGKDIQIKEVEKVINVGRINVNQIESVDRVYGIEKVNIGEITLNNISKVDLVKLKLETSDSYYFKTLKKNDKLPKLSKDYELGILIDQILSSDKDSHTVLIECSSSRVDKNSIDSILKNESYENAKLYKMYMLSKIKKSGKSLDFKIVSNVSGPRKEKGMKRRDFIAHQSVKIIAN